MSKFDDLEDTIEWEIAALMIDYAKGKYCGHHGYEMPWFDEIDDGEYGKYYELSNRNGVVDFIYTIYTHDDEFFDRTEAGRSIRSKIRSTIDESIDQYEDALLEYWKDCRDDYMENNDDE